jgi:hypothetical protein
MSEEKKKESPSSAENTNTDTDSKKDNGQGIDLTDEQLSAAFQHPRVRKALKEASEAKQEAERLRKQQEEAEAQELEEKEKYKELADKFKTKAESLESQVSSVRKENAVTGYASQQGVVDTEAVVKLLDLDSIELDENGGVVQESLKSAVDTLLENKPYLVKTNSANIGNKSQSGKDNDNKPEGKVFHIDEVRQKLSNHKWYQDNWDDVKEAMNDGRLLDSEGNPTRI